VSLRAIDVTTPVAIAGIWVFLFTRELKTRSLLPPREPSLKEALGHV